MAKRGESLRAEVLLESDQIERDEPFVWTVRFQNAGATTLHVSREIQSLNAHPDGSALEISTQRPLLADEVYIPFLSLPTVPVDPGASLDHPFSLVFPLRLARLTGVPVRAEVEEWVPSPVFELRMSVAFGDEPFHPPAHREELARALEAWARVLAVPPITVKSWTQREEA